MITLSILIILFWIFNISSLIILTFDLNSLFNISQKYLSFSIRNKFFGFFLIKYFVKFPVPGPISTIEFVLSTSPASQIFFSIFSSIKKF